MFTECRIQSTLPNAPRKESSLRQHSDLEVEILTNQLLLISINTTYHDIVELSELHLHVC